MTFAFDPGEASTYDESVAPDVNSVSGRFFLRLKLFALLPPRSMVGQLPLEQPIGVRIPGGQPIKHFLEPSRTIKNFSEQT